MFISNSLKYIPAGETSCNNGSVSGNHDGSDMWEDEPKPLVLTMQTGRSPLYSAIQSFLFAKEVVLYSFGLEY